MQQDQLYFFSKSADKPVGKGSNEYLNHPEEYKELNCIPHWRKVLSNFYEAPFVWENCTWKSVEHAFQSRKIALVDREKALWFTLESGHDIGQGDGLVARKNRKLIVLNDFQLREWNKIKSRVMEDILYAKFSQVEFARRVLLATRNAVLLHSTRGPAIRQVELERVRDRVRNSNVLN
ncbi:NADAR family protein [bacterium]|nr:NADAR family protein [Candidatus Elulimicrobium humile]